MHLVPTKIQIYIDFNIFVHSPDHRIFLINHRIHHLWSCKCQIVLQKMCKIMFALKSDQSELNKENKLIQHDTKIKNYSIGFS